MSDDVGWAGGNVGEDDALAAGGGPGSGGTGLGEIALARLEEYANLMDAGGDAARGGSGATAGSGESTNSGGEGEMCGIGDRRDGEGTVVGAEADAGGGDELAGG